MTRAKRFSWILGVIFIAIFVLGMVPTALAEDLGDIIITQIGVGEEKNSKVNLEFSVKQAVSFTADTIKIYGIYPSANQTIVTSVESEFPKDGTNVKDLEDDRYIMKVSVSKDFPKGMQKAEFFVLYTKNDSGPLQQSVDFYFEKTSAPTTTPDPNDNQTPGETIPALVLDSTRLDGTVLAAPKGDAGDTIRVVLPIRNRASEGFVSGFSGIVKNGEVAPVISADLNTFPFELQEMVYMRPLPTMAPGAKTEVVYDFKISKNATSGVKAVTFNAVYDLDNVRQTAQFTVFVNVIKGAQAEIPGGQKPVSVPKIIIDAYKLSPDKLFAGEEFKLSMDFTNTSDSEDVKNLKITVKDESGKILPAANGSNTLYVKKIAKGDTVTCEIALQSAPDIEAKSHTLTVAFNYEGGSTLTTYDAVETLSLPISQRIRLKIDDPVIYADSAMVGQPVGMFFSLYNMGKSTIYNCMVSVEGEGLSMEETYFGGNIGSGSSMQADFAVIPSVAGQIQGTVVITYEDAYGEQLREEKPFELFVMEDYVVPPDGEFPGKPGDGDVFNPGMPVKQGMPGWLIIVLIVAGVAALIFGIRMLVKARRKRELEEL
ncbi:MAG: hypothetical protein BWY11_02216 [Firmicutes bacterium ADurb.Bin182]|nr:MAG: hypothetical protein BWY11_02216 [Firmicutes bacterium ADurb.Bin182]